jgi:uncharacterized protein YggT (Ycf19 family)
MNEWVFRVLYLLRFVAFMAVVYLGLHLLVARIFRSPTSKVAAFFTIVTAPLVRPVRGLLPPGRTEQQVRLAALVMFLVLWLSLALVSAWAGAGVSRS